MIKFTTFELHNAHGTYIDFCNDGLTKTAGYSQELKDRLSTLEKKADHTYVLVNAMGSGEFWGANRNGDYFPDSALHRDHKTFEKMGRAYKHHVNKDPEKSFGKVPISVFNPDMHRVELVLELDNQRAKDVLDRIEGGEYPAVSMGVKVPHDTCSICGQKSKRVKDYCSHLKNQMGLTLSDGRKVYAVNDTDLKFFDISFVRIPADRTAGVLSKVASAEEPVIPSAVIGEEYLKMSGIKESTITKQIEGQVDAVNTDPKNLIYDSQRPIPREDLEKILEQYDLRDILSTMAAMRMSPRPMEFQRIILIKAGRRPLADEAEKRGALLMDLEEEPEVPGDINFDHFNDELAHKIAHWAPGMSMTVPHVMRRVLIKRAEDAAKPNIAVTIHPPTAAPILKSPQETTFAPMKNPLLPLLGLGGLYIGYNAMIDNLGFGKSLANQGKFEQFLLQKPWLIPILLGAAAIGTQEVQSALFKTGAFQPHFLKRLLVAMPSSYIYAGAQENKLQRGETITEFDDFVRRHPAIAGAAGTWGLGKMYQLFKRGPIGPGVTKTAEVVEIDVVDRLVTGLTPDKLDELFLDVIDAKY